MVSREVRLNVGEVAISEGAVILWQCPNCTWFRCRKNNTEWDNQVLYHPVYGNITNYYLYIKDINHHNCELTRSRRIFYGIDPDASFEKYRRQRLSEGAKAVERR